MPIIFRTKMIQATKAPTRMDWAGNKAGSGGGGSNFTSTTAPRPQLHINIKQVRNAITFFTICLYNEKGLQTRSGVLNGLIHSQYEIMEPGLKTNYDLQL